MNISTFAQFATPEIWRAEAPKDPKVSINTLVLSVGDMSIPPTMLSPVESGVVYMMCLCAFLFTLTGMWV